MPGIEFIGEFEEMEMAIVELLARIVRRRLGVVEFLFHTNASIEAHLGCMMAFWWSTYMEFGNSSI